MARFVSPEFDAVTKPLRHALLAGCYRWGIQGERAEDVVQNTLLAAWQRYSQNPASIDDLRTWLFGIHRNNLSLYYRHAARDQRRSSLEAAWTLFSCEQADRGARNAELREYIHMACRFADLTPAESAAVRGFLDGFTGRETAHRLGVHPNTVCSALRTARHKLAQYFDRVESLSAGDIPAELAFYALLLNQQITRKRKTSKLGAKLAAEKLARLK